MQTLRNSIILFIFIYGLTTCVILSRYDWNYSGMVNFGLEFIEQNKQETPSNIIAIQNEDGDLGAGYDGQIFYYFSRSISNLSLNWPIGFDESYRAPRIGYPLLISLFGFFGKKSAIFGMYFWNIVLHFLSFLALQKLLDPSIRKWSYLYLVSPFALGSYSVLVSDSVMVSLVVLSYYFFVNEKYLIFIPLASLAILTKEPSLFFLFPLGLKYFIKKDFKICLIILSTLVIPIFWHMYLQFTFPNWNPTRLTDFILPLEGIRVYLDEIYKKLNSEQLNFRELARVMGRFPLILLFCLGIILLFSKNWKKGCEFRIALALTLFMIGTAGHYHFWSVYENISRMFTISIPIIILWKQSDETLDIFPYFLLTILILILFVIKLIFITKPLPHIIWG